MTFMNKLKERVCAIIDENRELICDIGNQIYRNPELGYKEIQTSQLVQNTFEKFGYTYRNELAITGVKAKLNDDTTGPNICIIGELDSVVCPDHPDANKLTGAAHCCGHFAQVAAMLGCAIAFSKIKDEINPFLRQFDTDLELKLEPKITWTTVKYKKTGKKVWVAPYVKGDPSKKKGKTYVIK